MSSPTETFSSTLGPMGAGREYTFRQLLAIAARQVWSNKWRFLAIGATVIAIEQLTSWLGSSVRAHWIMSLYFEPWQSTAFLVALLACSGIWMVKQWLDVTLLEGFKWSAIRSYDRGRMPWGALVTPWRRPCRRTFLLYTLLFGLIQAVRFAGFRTLFRMTCSSVIVGGPFGWDHVMFYVSCVLEVFADAAIALGTLLVVPIICSDPQPRLRWAFRRHVDILRNQPRRLIAVVGIWAAASLVIAAGARVYWLHIYMPFAAPANPVVYWTMTNVPEVLHQLLLLLFLHLAAVIFRAAYGLPLEPVAAGDDVAQEPADVQ